MPSTEISLNFLRHPMARRIKHWALNKLIPFAPNPRTHSDAQVGQIAASIAEFGLNDPIPELEPVRGAD